MTTPNYTANLIQQIERLKSENQSLKESKWISVDERKPENNEKVICVNRIGNIEIGYWSKEYDDVTLSESWVLYATHWQPLPTPPTT